MGPSNGRYIERRETLKLLRQPFGLSILASLFWWVVIWRNEWFPMKGDEEMLSSGLIPTIGLFHAILAGHVVNVVWAEYKDALRCINSGNREGFKTCVRERIPYALHFLLGTMSIYLEVSTILYPYEKVISGVYSVFSLTFILVLYWKVATDLDDPRKAPWIAHLIPMEWLPPKKVLKKPIRRKE